MEKVQRPKTLAIEGKVINIEKIGSKSVAQFAAQLKQNGIVLDAERLEKIYNACGGGKSDEELIAIYEEQAKAAEQK